MFPSQQLVKNNINIMRTYNLHQYCKFLTKIKNEITLRRCPQHMCLSSSSIVRSSVEDPASHWRQPTGGFDVGINVVNSLTKNKVKVPLLLKHKNIATWYACGPTVYDSAHIGHASSYVRFDIIRRILSEHFNTDIVQVMGITDIDDKIIKRSQELNIPFNQLAQMYTEEFLQDMNNLNVLPATIYTKVTDHIAEITLFIQRIIDNGYAYATPSGSVYFDVNTFGLHQYGKLSALGDAGTTGEEENLTEKRNSRDFALWKASKPNEPWWTSPWGNGRPGWHIECSVMASGIFGKTMDIHTGGRDLAFPHHTNEIAQCEACFKSNQWANYFLHSGHLFLKHDADKMSKSLNNVISIQDLLQKYTANQFRLFCLVTKYNNDIEYSDETMQKAVTLANQISSFLSDSDTYVKGQLLCQPMDEPLLMQRLSDVRVEFTAALSDDFNTHRALEAVIGLVNVTNQQLQTASNKNENVPRSPGVIAMVSTYVNNVMNSLGVTFSARNSSTTASSSRTLSNVLDTSVGFRHSVRQWALDTSNSIVQDNAITPKEKRKAVMQERRPVMDACDKFRDDLAKDGVQIKDRDQTATWEYVEKPTSKST